LTGRPVVIAPKAAIDIAEIYNYNAERRGVTPADRYEAFLKARIYSLATEYDRGKIVEARPELRYLLVKKRSGGDGHLAVYRVDNAGVVRVLHVFHTKQDWQNKL